MELLEENIEDIVKCEVYLDRIFYPKFTKEVGSGEFAIFKAIITKQIENCKDDLYSIKLKGTVPHLTYGTTYKVYCKLKESDEQYGDTYEIIYMSKCIDISSKDKQKEFLRNILNENLVDKLFDTYDDVIKLLEEKDIESLVKIKGIGNQVALKMIDEYEDSKDYSAIYMELGRLGLTHTFIKKLVDFYHSPDVVIDVIKNNPYDLVRVDGVGFKKADEVACKIGIGQYDIRRIKGFLLHYLNEQGETGKSYLYYQDLMKSLYDTLGYVPEEVVTSTAQNMIKNEDVVVLDNGNKIALKKYYDLENNITKELIRLQIGKIEVVESEEIENPDEDDIFNDIHQIHDYIPRINIPNDISKIISNVEEEQGFEFTNEQKNAIELSKYNNVIGLTGLGGTGKSATARGMCKLYKDAYVLCVALSGKAAVRITESTGYPASTIHKALGYQNGMFTFNKNNKLPVDIVLIDEATMINGTLFLALLEAIPSGCKVYILGDPNQLTSIGNCQVFTDILNSNVIPTVRLVDIHRQAKKSSIITTGIQVANQEQIFPQGFTGHEIRGELKDVELNIYQSEKLSDQVIKCFQKEMEQIDDIMELQIVVAMKLRGDLSCFNLNTMIQNIYNPKFSDGNEIEVIVKNSKNKDEIKKYTIRKGDKVLNTKNNYKCIDVDGKTTPVFNGNMGIVKDIDENGYCTVDFTGIGEIVLNKSDAKNLQLSYACTCHKVQGSQADIIIVALDNSSYVMNCSELFYTMISRAKKKCDIYAINSAIEHAIKNKELKTKQTFLKDMLIENQYKLNEEI